MGKSKSLKFIEKLIQTARFRHQNEIHKIHKYFNTTWLPYNAQWINDMDLNLKLTILRMHSMSNRQQSIQTQSNRQTFSSHVLGHADNPGWMFKCFPTRHSPLRFIVRRKSLELIRIESWLVLNVQLNWDDLPSHHCQFFICKLKFHLKFPKKNNK